MNIQQKISLAKVRKSHCFSCGNLLVRGSKVKVAKGEYNCKACSYAVSIQQTKAAPVQNEVKYETINGLTLEFSKLNKPKINADQVTRIAEYYRYEHTTEFQGEIIVPSFEFGLQAVVEYDKTELAIVAAEMLRKLAIKKLWGLKLV